MVLACYGRDEALSGCSTVVRTLTLISLRPVSRCTGAEFAPGLGIVIALRYIL